MKKLTFIALIVSLVPSFAFAQFSVPQGGTGKTSFPQNSLIYSDNGSLQRLQATSSPTVNFIVATSTTASILPYASTTNITSFLASTTNLTVSAFPLTILSTAAAGVVQGTTISSPLSFSGSTLSCPTCNTSSATVSSVGLTSSDSTLTISSSPITTSGTLGAVLNLAHGNTWTALQQFSNASTTQLTVSGPMYDSTNSPGTAAKVWTSNGANTAPSWQSAASGGSSATMVGSAPISSGNFATNSTTTAVVTGHSYLVNMTCSSMGNVDTYRLDVGKPSGGATPTTTLAVTQLSTTNTKPVVLSNVYIATSTGTAYIALDDSTGGLYSNCKDAMFWILGN